MSDDLISSKQTLSSNQCLCCCTGLKLSWPKTKLQNVSAGDPSSTILIDHGLYAVLHRADRLQLGWLTRGVDPGVGRSDHLNYVGGVRLCFDPLNVTFCYSKLLLYNCKFHSIKDEQLDTIQ